MYADEVIATLINKLQTLDSDIKTKTETQSNLNSELQTKNKEFKHIVSQFSHKFFNQLPIKIQH
jgi:hypothetical protein